MPLVSSFILSSKNGKEAIVIPIVDREKGKYRFTVKVGGMDADTIARAKKGTKAEGSANFTCLISGAPISGEGHQNRGARKTVGARLMAVVTEGKRGRIYLDPQKGMEETAQGAEPNWKPEVEFFPQALGFRIGNYGMSKWSDLSRRANFLHLRPSRSSSEGTRQGTGGCT